MDPKYMHVIYVFGVLISGHIIVRGRRACSLGIGGLGEVGIDRLHAYGYTHGARTRRNPLSLFLTPAVYPPSSFSHFHVTFLLLRELSPSSNQKMLISGHHQSC